MYWHKDETDIHHWMAESLTDIVITLKPLGVGSKFLLNKFSDLARDISPCPLVASLLEAKVFLRRRTRVARLLDFLLGPSVWSFWSFVKVMGQGTRTDSVKFVLRSPQPWVLIGIQTLSRGMSTWQTSSKACRGWWIALRGWSSSMGESPR